MKVPSILFRRQFLCRLGSAALGALTLARLTASEVPDHLIGTPPESYPFNWGEGVQMLGLMKLAAVQRDPRYMDYVERWAGIYEQKDPRALLNLGQQAAVPGRPGYCGHWVSGAAVLDLYRERRKPQHLKLARDIVEFIRTGAERSPEGGLSHWQGSHQLWVDTLYMACPLLARMGHMERQTFLIEDAARQIIVHSRHLQDPRTGLFYHMWDWQTESHSEGFWGRGNGWVLMSLADTMEVMKKSDPKFKELEQIARNLLRGLSANQDAGGMWHTVLDDPRSYAETSATAMFSYGLLKLARMRVLPSSSRARGFAAWKAINDRYVRDGVVLGVSARTGPQGIKAYLSAPAGSETWGTGAYLLAASEIARDQHSRLLFDLRRNVAKPA